MPDDKIFLSVIIPAYNEEKRLPKTLQAVGAYLQKQHWRSEIIVVSDGSKDRTAEAAQAMTPQMPYLRVIANKENHGKGYVVRQGILEANGEYRIFMDADNSTSVDQVEKMLPWFSAEGGSAPGGEQGFGIVIGSRDIKGAVIATPQSWLRKLLGNIFNLIVQTISGLWGIWDTQCGFKGFSKEAVEKIFPLLTINRWAFDVEILAVAKKFNIKIKEIPVTWINDANSKVKFSGMVKMLFEVLQVRLNLLTNKYAGK